MFRLILGLWVFLKWGGHLGVYFLQNLDTLSVVFIQPAFSRGLFQGLFQNLNLLGPPNLIHRVVLHTMCDTVDICALGNGTAAQGDRVEHSDVVAEVFS